MYDKWYIDYIYSAHQLNIFHFILNSETRCALCTPSLILSAVWVCAWLRFPASTKLCMCACVYISRYWISKNADRNRSDVMTLWVNFCFYDFSPSNLCDIVWTRDIVMKRQRAREWCNRFNVTTTNHHTESKKKNASEARPRAGD